MGKKRGHRAPRPTVGAIVTGTVVGEAKRGVRVEVGSAELLLPRARFGASADRIEAAGYGTALTVEVVAEPNAPGGVGLSRIGIERSVRQPRRIDGQLRPQGAGLELVPSDGGAAFSVVLLDRSDAEAAAGEVRPWLVGAPHRGLRFVLPDEA